MLFLIAASILKTQCSRDNQIKFPLSVSGFIFNF